MTIRRMAYIALSTALICALTYLYVPTPWGVPITGQTLAVLVAGLTLSPIDGVLTVALYLTMGIIGLPVFSGAKSGVGVLLGPTGGYLWSFLVGIYFVGVFARVNKPILGVIIFTLITYVLGCGQLAVVAQMPLIKAFQVGMLPFIAGDLIKISLSLTISKRLLSGQRTYDSLQTR